MSLKAADFMAVRAANPAHPASGTEQIRRVANGALTAGR